MARTFAKVFPAGRSGALRVAGQVAWIRGRRRAARNRLREAAAVAREIGMVLEEAHALLSLAEILPERDRERQEALDQCRRLIQGREGLGAFGQRLRYQGIPGGGTDGP